MKFCFRLQLKKKRQLKRYRKSSHLIHLFDPSQRPIDDTYQLSNNMTHAIDSSAGDQGYIPSLVDEQQIANAQEKVDRLMTVLAETYEKTLVRNLHLEDLDMRSSDLFRDAEKMKNMAHKMQDKFFWEDSTNICSAPTIDLRISLFLEYWLIVGIASVSAVLLGGLLALTFLPKLTNH